MRAVAAARDERVEATDGAAHYDRCVVPFTEPYTRALMDALRVGPPRQVLDHGAGTGTLTAQILRTSPGARVTALDPSEAMLRRLAERLDGSDRERVEILQGTAVDVPATRRFDAIVSQLAFMFVPHPEVDLRLLRDRAESGATLCVSVLGGRPEVAAFGLFWSAAAEVDSSLAGPDAYPHFRFGDPAGLIDVIGRAGWVDVECTRVTAHREVGTDELWEWLSGAMPLRTHAGEPAQISPATRERLRVELAERAEEFAVGAGRVRLPMHGWCLTATAT